MESVVFLMQIAELKRRKVYEDNSKYNVSLNDDWAGHSLVLGLIYDEHRKINGINVPLSIVSIEFSRDDKDYDSQCTEIAET